MLKRILSLFALGLLVSPSSLRADTITTFALDGFTFFSPGILYSGAILIGTITMNVTTGMVTGINATFISESEIVEEFTVVRTYAPGSGRVATAANGVLNIFASLQLIFPISSLVGYTGGTVCTYPTGKNCPYGPVDNPGYDFSSFSYIGMFEYDYVQSGTLDPISPLITPEPSTFVLVGSGLIGALCLTGAVRRRLLSC